MEKKTRVGIDIPEELAFLVKLTALIAFAVSCMVPPVHNYPALATGLYVLILSVPIAVAIQLVLFAIGWLRTRLNTRKSKTPVVR